LSSLFVFEYSADTENSYKVVQTNGGSSFQFVAQQRFEISQNNIRNGKISSSTEVTSGNIHPPKRKFSNKYA